MTYLQFIVPRTTVCVSLDVVLCVLRISLVGVLVIIKVERLIHVGSVFVLLIRIVGTRAVIVAVTKHRP